MSYKAGIITAITGLKDRTGSSSIAIKKSMQASLPTDKKWLNAMFLGALKKMVADGILVKVKDSYKISADYKKKASKPKKAAPKKKTAPKKKAAPKKKTAPKKKAAPKKKSEPKKKSVSFSAFI
jgi:histone H1/5